MKQGVLVYDQQSDRMDVRFGLKIIMVVCIVVPVWM